MKRREFITVLGGAAAWPFAVRAEPSKLPTIGYLGAYTPSASSHLVAAFAQRLRELGWIEGRTIAIEYRWAEGRTERFADIAAELVRLKVDVIVTQGTESVIAAKQATTVIPIVFALAGDPVGSGLVASLARPGSNVTGLSIQSSDLAGKRLGLLREVVPDLGRLTILANIGNPAGVLEMGEVQTAARTLGIDAATFEIRRAEDIAPAFEALKGRTDALYVCGDPIVFTKRIQISILRRATADDLPWSGVRRTGRSAILWRKLPGPVAARRRLYRQNSARGKAGRHPCRAADQIRSRHQSDDRQGARPDDSGIVSGARRRGD
jgi:putative tryptophan/tyrosine transport system substrate-binding protein